MPTAGLILGHYQIAKGLVIDVINSAAEDKEHSEPKKRKMEEQ